MIRRWLDRRAARRCLRLLFRDAEVAGGIPKDANFLAVEGWLWVAEGSTELGAMLLGEANEERNP